MPGELGGDEGPLGIQKRASRTVNAAYDSELSSFLLSYCGYFRTAISRFFPIGRGSESV